MTRTRTRQKLGSNGRLIYPGDDGWSPPFVLTDETVKDEVLPGNGHKFSVRRYGVKGEITRFSGKGVKPYATTEARDFIIPRLAGPDEGLLVHSGVGGVPSVMAAATELVAKTNPSRPQVDLPVFIMELREIPNLLLKRSEDLGRDISSGRLSNEFGWKPFIGDLLNILSFTKEFEGRVRELEHLARTGIRRKRKLFSGSSAPVEFRNGSYYNNRGLWINGVGQRVTKVDVWGFCRWVPDRETLDYKLGLFKAEPAGQALMAMLGITPTIGDLVTVWELLPFSWLADWCSNTGDYLSSHRNTVGALAKDIQIMFHWYSEATHTFQYWGDNFVPSPRVCTRFREDKSREPVSTLTLEAHMPFLNERKVAILADVVNGIFRRSKIDHRKDAKTTWKFQESTKGDWTSVFTNPLYG